MRPSFSKFSLFIGFFVIGASAAAETQTRSGFLPFAGVHGLDQPATAGFLQVIRSAAPGSVASLPAHWDWRDVGGRNFLSSPKDQGSCGSCVAFAVLDTLETQRNIARNQSAAVDGAFSRQFLFSCGGGSCRGGMDLGQTLAFLQTNGVPEEACLPYTSGAAGLDVQCSDSCSAGGGREIRILAAEPLTDGIADISAIKTALHSGPVLTSIILFEDFMSYQGGIYRHKTGLKLGSHAVTLIGWDDSEKVWIARNSFGADWGENGYFRIAWDDALALPGRYTWKLSVPADDEGYVTVAQPAARSVVRGHAVLQVKTTFANPSKIEWFLGKDAASLDQSTALLHGIAENAGVFSESQGSRTAMVGTDMIDTSTIADGHYFITAKVSYVNGVAETVPQEIFVLNGTLQGALGFSNLTDGSQLSGLRKLTINAPSDPVPYQELSLIVTNEQSGEVFRKTTKNVAPATVFQWATNALPNGFYLLSLSATAGEQAIASKRVRVELNN